MHFLMITRKVDKKDTSPAGFIYNWLDKLGEKLEKLYVISWQEGDRGNLPENIKIEYLSGNKFIKVFFLWGKLLKILPEVDGVFCHQNPEYTILAAPLAKIFRKKVVSWYTHKEVNWKLHLVNFLADRILTASKESCRLENRKKIEITGHGIDVDYFSKRQAKDKNKEKFKIVSIGRISPVKDYETLIEAGEILVNQKGLKNLEIQIIGGPVLENEQNYFENLRQLVKGKNLEDYIKFLGPVPHNQIVSYYQGGDLFINLSQTGSVDKAVLEAMACQRLVLTSNEAFVDILDDQRLLFEPKNPQDLAQKIINLINLSLGEKEKIGQQLRDEVVKNHNLDRLAERIINAFGKIIHVYAFPYRTKNDRNPYFKLLYSHILEESPNIEIEQGRFYKLLFTPFKVKNIIHLHWINVLYGSRFFLVSAVKLIINFSLLFIYKLRGMKVVWTMHNYVSHDFKHPLIDKLGRKLIIKLAEVIIVHSQVGKNYLKDTYQRKRDVFVIPHVNYINFYGDLVKDRLRPREKLGYQKSDIIFLNLGMLRPYKGLEELIKFFNQFSNDDILKLLILGKGDDLYIEKLKNMIKNENIVIENKFIPNEKIPLYFALADFSIFDYKEILTSGAAILSLSYAVPVIAPRQGDLIKLIKDGQNGFLFNNEIELEKIISQIKNFPLAEKEKMRQISFSSAQGLSSTKIAQATIKAYNL